MQQYAFVFQTTKFKIQVHWFKQSLIIYGLTIKQLET